MKDKIKKIGNIIIKRSYFIVYISVIVAIVYLTYILAASASISDMISKYASSYLFIIFLVAMLLLVLSLALQLAIHKRKKIIISLLVIVLIVSSTGLIVGANYIKGVQAQIDNISTEKEKNTVSVKFITLNDSGVTELKDIGIGMLNNTESKNGYIVGNDYVQNNSSLNLLSNSFYENWNDLFESLTTGKEKVISVPSSYESLLEENELFLANRDNIVELGSHSMDFDLTNATVKVDAGEPFNLLIIGVDKPLRDDEDQMFLFDVIVLATIDPKNGEILLTSIPRDTLFYSPCIGGVDKINHNGALASEGIDCLEQSIESTLDTTINSYILIDFSGIVSLVDSMGGVVITNPYGTFISQDQNRFANAVEVPGGTNLLNGEQTLAFARNRTSTASGPKLDATARSGNHAVVIKAILNRLKEIGLGDVRTYVDIITKSTRTNYPVNDLNAITELFTYLSKSGTHVKSITIDGVNVIFKSPMMGGQGLYGTDPYVGKIEYAKDYINLIMDNEFTKFDNSFHLNSGVKHDGKTLGLYTPGKLGRPDADGDGIPDSVDRCKYEYAPGTSNGCPVAKPPVTTDPGTTDPGTTDPGTTDPGTTDPGTTDPGTTDPGTTDPGTTDPGTTDPGTTDPGTTDPGTTDPGTSGDGNE